MVLVVLLPAKPWQALHVNDLVYPGASSGPAPAVVVATLNGRPVPQMPPGNTCYSWVSDREAIAVVNSYRIENGKVVQIEQKLTPAQSTAVAANSLGWAQSIWADVVG